MNTKSVQMETLKFLMLPMNFDMPLSRQLYVNVAHSETMTDIQLAHERKNPFNPNTSNLITANSMSVFLFYYVYAAYFAFRYHWIKCDW